MLESETRKNTFHKTVQNIFSCPRCFKLRCPVHQLQYDLFLSSFISTFIHVL